MPDVPLSVAGVRRMRDNLARLAAEMRDSVPVDIERGTGELLAGEVRSNIAGIQDVDGNYLGSDNPNAAVSVEVALDRGHEVIWRGEQIKYLEFGTGAPGAAHPYPGVAMAAAGYYPDPTKDMWWYLDAKVGPWVSLGLVPQAPMYMASIIGRRVLKRQAAGVLREAVRRADTL